MSAKRRGGPAKEKRDRNPAVAKFAPDHTAEEESIAEKPAAACPVIMAKDKLPVLTLGQREPYLRRQVMEQMRSAACCICL
jgi:hypothetical protein